MKVFLKKKNKSQENEVYLCPNENEEVHIDVIIMLGTVNH
jgi:hypothetical protein